MPTKPPSYRPPGIPGMGASTKAKLDARAIRASARWVKLRRIILANEPLCQHPDCIPRKPAIDVHHIKPLDQYPELAFDMANLATLCRACHVTITHAERRGPVAPIKWVRMDVQP